MLRAQRDSQEMEGFTGKPTISPFAAEYSQARDKFHKASGSLVVVQERLHNLHQRKLERKEVAKQKYAKESESREMEEVTAKPRITQKARAMPARGTQAEITSKWLDEHKKRLQRLHEEALVREMSDVQPGPVVAPYSAELARLRHTDPNSSRFEEDVKQRRAAGSIADYLLAKEEERLLRLKMKAAEADLDSGHSFHPQISRRAHSAHSTLDVTQRLVRDAEQKRNISISYSDGNCTFAPVVSEESKRIVEKLRDSSIASSSRQHRQGNNQCTFKPEIGAVSRKLAEERKHRADLDLSSVRKSSRASSVSNEPISQPKISAKSRAMAEDHYARIRSTIRGGDALTNDELRLVAAERANQRRAAAATRQREMQAAADEAECTFQPRLSTILKQPAPVSEDRAERFYERNLLWTSRRDRTLQQQRNMESTKGLEECTFQPRIHDQVPLPAAAHDPGLKSLSVLAPGSTTFFQRMNEARARKSEGERRKNGKPTTTRPTGGYTTPIPFKLGKERATEPLNHEHQTHQWSAFRATPTRNNASTFFTEPPSTTPIDFVLGNHDHIASKFTSSIYV